MSPFPNLGWITGLDGKIIPLPRHVIQRSGSASATDARTTNTAVIADMPNMTVTLNLEVPCVVLLAAVLRLTCSATSRLITVQFTDAANNLVGLAWTQNVHSTEEVFIVPLLALTTGVVGVNTWKVRWATTVVSIASVTNRYMIAIAWPS